MRQFSKDMQNLNSYIKKVFGVLIIRDQNHDRLACVRMGKELAGMSVSPAIMEST